MLNITLIILFLLAFQGYKREKSIVNFQTIFCLLWSIICYAASLKLYNMIKFSDDTYIVVLLGCLGFSIGNNIYKCPSSKVCYRNKYIINNRTFDIFYYITAIFIIYFAIKTYYLLRMGVPYAEIRDLFGYSDRENSMITSKFETLIKVFILMPIIPIFNCLLLLHILKIIKLNKKRIIQIILLSLLYIFVSGSRIVITNLMIQGILFIFLFKIKLSKVYIRKLIAGIILLLFTISTISENRKKEFSMVNWGVSNTYYAYCALPIPMCYYYMEKADKADYRSFGLSFFKGPIGLILYPLSFIGIPRPNAYIEMDNFYKEIAEYIPIFYGVTHNAYVSIFFYFYLDFGLFGVLLGSLLYASFLKLLYKKTIEQYNLRYILLFLIALISLSKSFSKWEFQDPGYILSFIYIFIITIKNKHFQQISYRKVLK